MTKKSQCTEMPSYLEPISGSLQKPKEGLSTLNAAALNKGGYRQKSHNSTAMLLASLFLLLCLGLSFLRLLF